LEVGKVFPHFCLSLTTNLTQHDSHGPDDHPKTIACYYGTLNDYADHKIWD
jgi:hypothetical protein